MVCPHTSNPNGPRDAGPGESISNCNRSCGRFCLAQEPLAYPLSSSQKWKPINSSPQYQIINKTQSPRRTRALSGPTKKLAVSFFQLCVARIDRRLWGDESGRRRDHASSVASPLLAWPATAAAAGARESPSPLAPSDVALISWQHSALSCSFKAPRAPVAARGRSSLRFGPTVVASRQRAPSATAATTTRAGTKPANNNVERG